MKLRSVFEPGTWQWALRRAQWRAIGLKEEDFYKPKIAVVNSSSNISVCYIHLDEISSIVQQAIREAGGVPFEIRTTAPSDIITSAGREARYLMPSRDLIVNDIEVMVEGALLDGMVCLSSCDKTTPAHLMAAARLNIPTIIVPCGYQLGGNLDSNIVDIEDVFEAVGAVKRGSMSLSYLQAMTEVAICGPGVCAGLGTANTMHMVAEALGMALAGSSPIRGGSEKLFKLAREAGVQIIRLIEKNIKPRDIITEKSIENAVRVVQAIGGSVNSIRHLTAIAVEAELDIDVIELFEKTADDSVLICAVKPNGPYSISELEKAGGTLGVMKQIIEKLHKNVITVNGCTLGEILEKVTYVDERVIRPVDRPFRPHPGLLILRGNLAPKGSIVKISAVQKGLEKFEGTARVYESEEQAISEINEIEAGEVVVLRGMGPKGGPGTVFAAGFVAAANGAGISQKIAVITDGELSGLNRGLVVGQVMPEAYEGGPLAVVENGDKILIDLKKRRVDILISDTELKERLKNWKPKQRTLGRSWLSIYAQVVQSVYKGAVLGPIKE